MFFHFISEIPNVFDKTAPNALKNLKSLIVRLNEIQANLNGVQSEANLVNNRNQIKDEHNVYECKLLFTNCVRC